jgi:hypothetical protein
VVGGYQYGYKNFKLSHPEYSALKWKSDPKLKLIFKVNIYKVTSSEEQIQLKRYKSEAKVLRPIKNRNKKWKFKYNYVKRKIKEFKKEVKEDKKFLKQSQKELEEYNATN